MKVIHHLLVKDSALDTKPTSIVDFSAGNYGQRTRQIKTKNKEMMKSLHTKLHSLQCQFNVLIILTKQITNQT